MPIEWNNDSELFDLMRRELFTSVIADTLDAHGYMNQMLPPHIRPLRAGMRVCGRALSVLETDSINDAEPYGVLFEALDDLKPNEIYLASGATSAYAMWGELMTTAAIRRGAVGALTAFAALDATSPSATAVPARPGPTSAKALAVVSSMRPTSRSSPRAGGWSNSGQLQN